MRKVDTLITGGAVVTMNAKRDVFSPGAVAIKDGKIVAVGPEERVRQLVESDKVWIRANGSWAMVPAPPNEGPFRWTRRGWERILAIPPGKKWVAPHWEKNRWVTGHWKIMRSKDPSRQWISGHWLKNGLWQTGFWKRIHPSPSSGIEGTWIPYTDGRPLRPHVPRKR